MKSHANGDGSADLPLFKVKVAPSRVAPGGLGLFPLHGLAAGEPIFHFHWRDHKHCCTPLAAFPKHTQAYLHSLWAPSGSMAVPNGRLFDPINFIQRVARHATMRYDPSSGDFFAVRELSCGDELTIEQALEFVEDSTDVVRSQLDALGLGHHISTQGSPGNPVLTVRLGISTIDPSMVGMFPLHPVAKGTRVFHFLWRDHARTYRADLFREEVQEYIWRLWAGAVPEGLTFDVVNFLNHTRRVPTVVYNKLTGDYMATRNLSPDDEIMVDYVGYNDAGLDLFYDDLSPEERAAVPHSWKARFRPSEIEATAAHGGRAAECSGRTASAASRAVLQLLGRTAPSADADAPRQPWTSAPRPQKCIQCQRQRKPCQQWTQPTEPKVQEHGHEVVPQQGPHHVQLHPSLQPLPPRVDGRAARVLFMTSQGAVRSAGDNTSDASCGAGHKGVLREECCGEPMPMTGVQTAHASTQQASWRVAGPQGRYTLDAFFKHCWSGGWP